MNATSFRSAVLIDVREPAEFRDVHLPGAHNLPSTQFNSEDYQAFYGRPIHLVCNTGERAGRIKKQLEANGFSQIHIHDIQMQSYQETQSVGIEGSWTVDRQFRLFLGVVLLIGLVGHAFVWRHFMVLVGIVCGGLIITAIIDRCFLKMGIARLPWNR